MGKVWADGPAGGTPIDAASLNDFETRITTLETTGGGGGISSVGYADLPAGTTVTVFKAAGVWPARPTSRSDIEVIWKGADPDPAIVSSGTGGMLDGVDTRFVTP